MMKKLPLLKSVDLLLACACMLAAIPSLQAQTVPPLDAMRVAGGFTAPLFVTAPPGDTSRLFVVQQTGQIRIIHLTSRTVNPTPYLDLRTIAYGGEQGLLGMAFDPNYATNGRFYINYTRRAGHLARA